MKTFRQIDWRAVAVATRWFLMAMGVIGMIAWFGSAPFWIALFAGLWLAGIWYGFFQFVKRSPRGRWQGSPDASGRMLQAQPLPGAPAIAHSTVTGQRRAPSCRANDLSPKRRFFAYFDESGDPVYADF